MAKETKTIKVGPNSELASLLEQAAAGPVFLEKDGLLYRVTKADQDDRWADYDPAAVQAGIQAAAGSLTPAEADRLKAYIYRAREEGSRPERT